MKTITNPTNLQMATELCKLNPNSSYAKALGFDATTGELSVKDLSLFTSTPDIANEFLSDMANKIIVQKTYDLFKGYEMPFNVFQKAMSRLGDAEELLSAELSTPSNYDGTDTNPFDAPKPDIVLSWIKTEDKKLTKVRLSYEIWAGAFTTESGLSNIAGIILKNLRDSVEEYLRKAIRDDLANAQKVTKSATITTIAGAGATANSQKAYEEIIKLVTDMSIPSANYNTSGVETFTALGNAVLVLNSRYASSFDVNVLASLFNSAKIGEQKYFKKVIVTDLDQVGDGKCVGVVLDEDAYLWGYRFNVSQSINNPATLEVNTYYHAWIKRAVVPFKQAVRLVVA